MVTLNEKVLIANALEELVSKGIRDFEFGMNVLKLPASVRAPMWQAMSRRAMAKVMECEKADRS